MRANDMAGNICQAPRRSRAVKLLAVNSINEESTCVLITWRAISARPHPPAPPTPWRPGVSRAATSPVVAAAYGLPYIVSHVTITLHTLVS